MDGILKLIGRDTPLFSTDVSAHEAELQAAVAGASFLVIGGAGSIGHAVTREIFRRNPRKLHVVDISENNLVELVRDLRCSSGYIRGDFQTFALDVDSVEYDALMRSNGGYDYILNLSALKHVRSEKDPFTLMRMIHVNILNGKKALRQAITQHSRKYFCVSTDKSANPVNMMGASKRIMELFLLRGSGDVDVSTARFANVAFSDGSLLHGFRMRMQKGQPIVAPRDVRRYFLTQQEAGELCLLSCILGENREIFFPRLESGLHLFTFSELAVRFLEHHGYQPRLCQDEDEARRVADAGSDGKTWPCLFTVSDTTGEKDVEEFYEAGETLDLERFSSIGVICNTGAVDPRALERFEEEIHRLKAMGVWEKKQLVQLFTELLPDFQHHETGRNLDQKM